MEDLLHDALVAHDRRHSEAVKDHPDVDARPEIKVLTTGGLIVGRLRAFSRSAIEIQPSKDGKDWLVIRMDQIVAIGTSVETWTR